MLVIPAIDLQDGNVVRLYKGDYNKKTIYSNTPEKIAKEFEHLGAKYLHVVDLDGAKEAKTKNIEAIKKIRNEISIPMELGGGIRDIKTLSFYLDEIGIDRVILGTAALQDQIFLKQALETYGTRIVVGVDIKNGYVLTSGWLETSEVYYLDFIKTVEKMGAKYIVCTDISKDGTLTGPSFDIYRNIKKHSNLQIIVSGGIKDQEDIYQANKEGYYGCIIGKAYYEGKINLQEVIMCLQKESFHV